MAKMTQEVTEQFYNLLALRRRPTSEVGSDSVIWRCVRKRTSLRCSGVKIDRYKSFPILLIVCRSDEVTTTFGGVVPDWTTAATPATRRMIPAAFGTVATHAMRAANYATSSRISVKRSGMSTMTSWPHGTS